MSKKAAPLPTSLKKASSLDSTEAPEASEALSRSGQGTPVTLRAPPPAPRPFSAPNEHPLARRHFLGWLGVSLAGLGCYPWAGGCGPSPGGELSIEPFLDGAPGDGSAEPQREPPPELRPDGPPEVPLPTKPPRFSFVQISDSHYGTRTDIYKWLAPTPQLLEDALTFTNSLQPDFVVFTGDLISVEADSFNELTHFKKFVEERLKIPYYPVAGNHDGPDFSRVFGQDRICYSFEHKGIFFVALTIRYENWDAGTGTFEKMEWLQKTLQQNKGKPTVLLMHNPFAYPAPTFYNARQLDKVLHSFWDVRLCLLGHLHLDGHGYYKGALHLLCPMLIRDTASSPHYGFKLIRVYDDRFVVLSIQKHNKTYQIQPNSEIQVLF